MNLQALIFKHPAQDEMGNDQGLTFITSSYCGICFS